MTQEHFKMTPEMSRTMRLLLTGVTSCNMAVMDAAYAHLRHLVVELSAEIDRNVNELFEGKHDE